MADIEVIIDNTPQVFEIGEAAIGRVGPRGEKGDRGEPLKYENLTPAQKAEMRGPKGDRGERGERGEAGETGKPGLDGNPGPAGPAGKDGVGIQNVELDHNTHGLNITLTNGTKYTTSSVKGERGERGERGYSGEAGRDGVGISNVQKDGQYDMKVNLTDGNSYKITDVRGPKGDRGDVGERGPIGPKGDPLKYTDLTSQQKEELKGPKGDPGKPLTFDDLTEQQKAQLKGEKGEPGTTDYNQLTNKPDLTAKADVSYVDTRYAMLHTSKADKHYVDSQDTVLTKRIDTGLESKVNRAGDTMTGSLVLSTNTVNPLELATTSTASWQELNMSHMGSGTQNTIIFNAQNSANIKTRYAQIQAFMFDRQRSLGSVIISTSKDGGMRQVATFLAEELRLENSKLTFGASDVAMIAGNGMPNGKVLAPVGSTYIDRDATNGAIRWIKKTDGNSVNGWAVDYGDTGWRNITPNPLPANTDKTDCKIRRVNDVVEVAIGYTNVINATEMVYTNSLPLGFRPAQNVFVTGISTGPSTSRSGGVAIDGTRIRWQSTVGNWRTAYARYTTDDAWPATLPGA